VFVCVRDKLWAPVNVVVCDHPKGRAKIDECFQGLLRMGHIVAEVSIYTCL